MIEELLTDSPLPTCAMGGVTLEERGNPQTVNPPKGQPSQLEELGDQQARSVEASPHKAPGTEYPASGNQNLDATDEETNLGNVTAPLSRTRTCPTVLTCSNLTRCKSWN